MPSRSRRASLQDTKKFIQIEASRKALKQNNYQVFLGDWLYPYQRGRIYPHHQVARRTSYYRRVYR